eukprot:SAG11_NODE_6213_length_1363_cov_1.712816_1_plen_184_part_01
MRIAAWNCFGVFAERLEYLLDSEDGTKKGLFPATGGGEWILGLTECRIGGIERLADHMPAHRVSLSEPAHVADRAAGAALIFSPRLSRAVVDRGSKGSRIAWGQVETDVKGTDVIVIVVYVPHFGRQNPSATDVYGDLRRLYQEFDKDPRQRRAAKILMGDFNGRLARAYNFTGKQRPVKVVEG